MSCNNIPSKFVKTLFINESKYYAALCIFKVECAMVRKSIVKVICFQKYNTLSNFHKWIIQEINIFIANAI